MIYIVSVATHRYITRFNRKITSNNTDPSRYVAKHMDLYDLRSKTHGFI
jgi:hypothetical protein